MSNAVRQPAILRLVRDRAISTQGELVEALREEGHDVVQTTVSRDVHDLGLVKVRAPSGRLVYAAPGADDADRLRAIGVAMRRYAIARRARRAARRRDDAVRLRERARAGARRGSAPRDRRDDRGRQHDLPRSPRGNERRRALRRAGRAPRSSLIAPRKQDGRWGAAVSVILGRVGAMEIGARSLPCSPD